MNNARNTVLTIALLVLALPKLNAVDAKTWKETASELANSALTNLKNAPKNSFDYINGNRKKSAGVAALASFAALYKFNATVKNKVNSGVEKAKDAVKPYTEKFSNLSKRTKSAVIAVPTITVASIVAYKKFDKQKATELLNKAKAYFKKN